MNLKFLNILKPQVLSFIENATEDDCKLILGPVYTKDFYDFVLSLRKKQKGEQIQFVCGFPDQATILPCYAFVLGNMQSNLQMQTFSYETSEVSNVDWAKLSHLSSTVTNSPKSQVPIKQWIYNTKLVIAAYSSNKAEVNWLIQLIDIIVKMNQETFSTLGLENMSSDTTDLRIQQELFPLKVPTRVMSISFLYEQSVPLLDSVERHNFEGATGFNFQ